VTNYEIRPLGRADITTLLESTPEANLWGYMDETKIETLLMADSWTGLANGQIVACGGIVRIWPGLAEAWIAVTPLVRQYPVFVVRAVKEFLTVVTGAYGLRRIEAHVNAGFYQAVVFAERLGFKIDARLLKYGPNGETFYLMSLVM